MDVDLKSLGLEQRTRFSTTLDLGGIDPRHVFGQGEAAAMHVVIEGDAVP